MSFTPKFSRQFAALFTEKTSHIPDQIKLGVIAQSYTRSLKEGQALLPDPKNAPKPASKR